jgi:hypothetical protein
VTRWIIWGNRPTVVLGLIQHCWSAITNFLNDGHSKELISDRMDVSVDVLEKHCDARSESEKRELRREMFEMD